MGEIFIVSDDESGEECNSSPIIDPEEDGSDSNSDEELVIAVSPSSIDFFFVVHNLPVGAKFFITTKFENGDTLSFDGEIISYVNLVSTVSFCYQDTGQSYHDKGTGVMIINSYHSIGIMDWIDVYDTSFAPWASQIIESFTDPDPGCTVTYTYTTLSGESGENEWIIPVN
jgi:hypothetical protein